MDNVTKIHLELYRKLFENRNFSFENLIDYLLIDDFLYFLYTAWECICKDTKFTDIDTLTLKGIKSVAFNCFLYNIQTQNCKTDAILKYKIIKSNRKTSKLGIVTFKEKVVHDALTVILKPSLKLDFNNSSFGFRVHTSSQLTSFEVYK